MCLRKYRLRHFPRIASVQQIQQPTLTCPLSHLLYLPMKLLFVRRPLFPVKHTEESRRLVWNNPLDALKNPGWPGLARVERELWRIAERHLPQERAADYNQGLMDLGALVCTPRQPDYDDCPVADSCLARLDGLVDPFARPA